MLRYAVTMAGVMFIAVQTGLAAVVFSDSFEGVLGDPGPDLASSTGDYDPAWQFVTEGLISRQAVVYSNAIDTSAGSASALITAPAGQQALRLRAGGTAMEQSWLPTNAQATASLYHLEPAGNANTGKMFYFSLREGNVDAVTVGIDKDAGGNWGFGYYTGANAFVKLANVKTNEWVPISVYADAATQRFFIHYGTRLLHNNYEGYPFQKTIAGFTAIRLGQAAATGSTLNSYVDAVVVENTVPQFKPSVTVVCVR